MQVQNILYCTNMYLIQENNKQIKCFWLYLTFLLTNVENSNCIFIKEEAFYLKIKQVQNISEIFANTFFLPKAIFVSASTEKSTQKLNQV